MTEEEAARPYRADKLAADEPAVEELRKSGKIPLDKPDTDEVEKILMTLIQDEGLTPQRLALHGSEILDLIAIADPKLGVNYVVKVSETIEEDIGVALRNALGIGYEEETNLSQRRAMLVQRDDFPTISEATLRRWERKGITLLARYLIKRARPAPEARLIEQLGQMSVEEFRQVQGQPVIMMSIREELVEQTALLRELNENIKTLLNRLSE